MRSFDKSLNMMTTEPKMHIAAQFEYEYSDEDEHSDEDERELRKK